jgi:methylaspartate ammonia-lyase
VSYGLSQALLHGTALSRGKTMAEVVADEYGTTLATEAIPVAVSCEPQDWRQLDRMILKRAGPLPHRYFTDVDRDVGRHGEKLAAYVERVAKRVGEIGDAAYRPLLHFDMYGTLGELFGNNVDEIAAYLCKINEGAKGLALLIESPLLGRTREEQIELLSGLRAALARRGGTARIIADDWCNTMADIAAFAEAEACDFVQIKMPDLGGIDNSIAAVLFCKAHGMGAYLGGSANETDQSARISAHIALATAPAFVSAKPGLGGDEGVMILRNEMARTLALAAHRRAPAPAGERFGTARAPLSTGPISDGRMG